MCILKNFNVNFFCVRLIPVRVFLGWVTVNNNNKKTTTLFPPRAQQSIPIYFSGYCSATGQRVNNELCFSFFAIPSVNVFLYKIICCFQHGLTDAI